MLWTIYLGCAIFGGTIMFLQLTMTALGFGGAEDADGADFSGGDADASPDFDHGGGLNVFRMLSFRTVIAGLTFFGLAGICGLSGSAYFEIDPRFHEFISIVVAVFFGLCAISIVYYLYAWMYALRFDGSVSEKHLVGAQGTVYVKIPEHGAVGGKVLINQQERTMEYEAITKGESLKSGTPITVIGIISPSVVEVAKV